MRYCVSVFLFGLVTVWSSTAAAQEHDFGGQRLTGRIVGEALGQAFKGTTHDGTYNLGADEFRSYREIHHADNRVTYEEGALSASGVWGVQNDMLCFSYDDHDMNGGCFRVYKTGNCYFYYSAYIPETRYELDEDYWTARSVIEGEEPSCNPGVS